MGDAVSYGIHESQSRFFENNIGRSRPFWEYWFPKLEEIFDATVANIDFEEFYRFINKVKPSLIRVEADEVTYNLHIIIRFELERALVNGTIEVKDLPRLWNEKYKDYLGINVPDDYSGVLQDVQWYEGSFGYFPTYTLGTVCAAQLESALRNDVPDLDEHLRAGDFSVLLGWMHDHVHQYGSLYPPAELIEHATGKPLSAKDYVNYLTQKYDEIYELGVAESPSSEQ
jgi:carboxypeptidase Taq